MKNLLGLFRGGHRPDTEALSAYADGRLASSDAARLEQHLAECSGCARELEELSRVRAMLSSMGQVAVPRSFRLRQADVEAQGKAVAPESTFGRRALGFAPAVSMAAVVLFGAVLAADLGTRGDDGGGDMFAASRQGPSEGLTMTEDAAVDSAGAASGAEADGEAAPEIGAATALSPDESQGAEGDDSYYLNSPSAGQAPAPAADAGATTSAEATVDADTAEALNAPEEDDGVRAGYLVAEIALAALAIGAVSWLIYARTRTKEVAS